ncbi:hypothetical protein OCH239_10950 [Roseivivax halodurans JCM 10272]|uniref:Peptidase M41 domain-containing protein n=1 Tax=Roseivivax halodurans JCM 10272 TaxID=1449350 RepID=X7EE00_9RHOB|nr:hypothetical protein [Roseivivax halodurans]ETX13353.1 hypothetical protein OCH239_10950 [Roseivivax halodurans JCM 10272]
MLDFTRARDRILLPRSGGSIALLGEEREIIAINEAGHAVVALLSPHADPVEKVTITPQGAAMGFVLQSPDRDRVFETQARLEARLGVMAAGRMAEQLAFGEDMITTGAASGIQQATALARAMVTRYGMSDFGFVVVNPNDPALFDVNNPPARMISTITAAGMDRSRQVLEENLEGLNRLAVALLETETLSGEEARAIVTGEASGPDKAGQCLIPPRETERRMRLPRLSRSA